MLSLASTLRTMVRRGWRLASPPGGREEHPVVNCKKDFRSSGVKEVITLTNRWNPGLESRKNQQCKSPVYSINNVSLNIYSHEKYFLNI